jgi:hypothetical protein
MEFDRFDDDLDFVTNFYKEDLPFYKKAVYIFNDEDLFISDEAYDCYGNKLEGCFSLRYVGDNLLTGFWNILNNIRNNSREVKLT